jgi:hypothetical protein
MRKSSTAWFGFVEAGNVIVTRTKQNAWAERHVRREYFKLRTDKGHQESPRAGAADLTESARAGSAKHNGMVSRSRMWFSALRLIQVSAERSSHAPGSTVYSSERMYLAACPSVAPSDEVRVRHLCSSLRQPQRDTDQYCRWAKKRVRSNRDVCC